MNVLNDAYNATGFSFNLVSGTNIKNATWRSIEPESDLEYEMKSKLRKGKYRDLNLYIDSIAPVDGRQLLGYA